MSPTLLAAILALAAWIVVTFIMPLGPAGAALHLLLGLSGALFVRSVGLAAKPVMIPRRRHPRGATPRASASLS